MAPQKSPAFSFYAKDFSTGTASMSLQEVGAYIRLLAYQWDVGSIPNDPGERARILGCAKAQERDLWKRVGKKFTPRNDAYVNERLEGERKKQTERRQRLSDNGKLGGRPQKANEKLDESKSFPETEATEKQTQSLPSSSSFSSSNSQDASKNDASVAVTRPRPIISGASSPLGWAKQHGGHIPDFCDFVCFPEMVFQEFVTRVVNGGATEAEARKQVKDWARSVQQAWIGRIPGDSIFEFWRNEWKATHGTNRPSSQTAVDLLGGIRK